MNNLQRELMDKPSIFRDRCPFCGNLTQNNHHIVPRSQGGHNGPTVSVCGMGNTGGCHGKLHQHRIHLRWNNGWEWLETEPMKYDKALEMDGWRKL